MEMSIRLCTVEQHWNDFDGWGITVESRGTETPGVFIKSLRANCAGFRSGLKPGDKIIEVNGVNVETKSHREVVDLIKRSVNDVSLLVANPHAVEMFREAEVTITQHTLGCVRIKQSMKPLTIDDIGQFIENKISAWKNRATPERKYLMDIILLVPLKFLLHLLFILAPTSDYTILEIVLFALRILLGLMVTGCWGLGTKKLVRLYICMSANMAVGWLMEKMYLTYEIEALEICQDTWLPWAQDMWWTPALITLILQLMYMWYLIKTSEIPSKGMPFIFATLLPYMSCMFGFGLTYILPVHYWVAKLIFCVSTFIELGFVYDGLAYDNEGKLIMPPLPGPWFMRDVLALFTVAYLISCFWFDLLVNYSLSDILTLTYFASFLGTWCTSIVTVVAYGALFAVIACITTSVILKLIKGESDLRAILNSPLGSRSNLTFNSYCIEASIMYVSESDRILNMESIIFLTLFTILLQSWDLTEQQVLYIINSGDSNKCLNYLRVCFVSLLLLTLPTCLTIYLSPIVGVDWWLMLNLSGNLSMLVRSVLVLGEIILVSITWRVDNGLDKLEDAIYTIRVSKTAAILICGLLTSYYRYHAPFFSAWWVYRAFVVIADYGLVSFTLCKTQWASYNVRRQGSARINVLPDAESKELEEYADVCSVCYASMTNAKKLSCKHLFHANCLRKWFQVREKCPLCNTEVFLA